MGVTKTSVEKIGKGRVSYGRGFKRWYKRLSAKLMRRMARYLGEDAPMKLPTRGWTD